MLLVKGNALLMNFGRETEPEQQRQGQREHTKSIVIPCVLRCAHPVQKN
jgi:hypothetical protein